MPTSRSGARFDPTIDYYQLLNVPYGATGAEIRRAYRVLMRHTHPDHAATEQERKKAEERAKLLNAAYAVLSKPDVRRDYDQAIRRQVVSDALMQRYTGNTPGRESPFVRKPPVSPSMRRAQRSASRSALLHLVIITIVFAVVVVLLVVVAALVPQAIHALVG